jgi:hypothetical protein
MVMSASSGKDAIHEDVSPDHDQCVPKRLFLDDASLVFSVPLMVLMWSDPGPHTGGGVTDVVSLNQLYLVLPPSETKFRLPISTNGQNRVCSGMDRWLSW